MKKMQEIYSEKWDNVKRICENPKDRRVPKSPMMRNVGDREL